MSDMGSELLDVARSYRTRILAEREHIEHGRRVPDDLARDLARDGFFRISLPRPYGGLDLAPTEAIEILEEFAQSDASVAWCIWNGNSHWIATQLSPEVVRTVHADADTITANSTRTSGTAEVVDGGYRVNGRWSMVSGCQLASWMVLLCVVHADRKPKLAAAGLPESRFMLLPASQCEIIDTWTVGGLRGTGSHDVVVRDVFVPLAFAAGYTDPHVLPDLRYRIPPFSRVIPGLGSMALGIARSAIECFKDVAGAKTPERTRQMLCHNPGAQVRVSQAESLVRSSRLFLLDSLERLWRTLVTTGDVSMEARAEARLAASHAVASAVQAVDLLYIGAGASSLYVGCPLEQAFRDVHAITLHIGVHPRVMESTGRVLFSLESETPLL
jgi:indole-3-acetate monooxygenase